MFSPPSPPVFGVADAVVVVADVVVAVVVDVIRRVESSVAVAVVVVRLK